MAKFTAKQPTSNVVLLGLGILANPSGVRFDDIEGDGFTAKSSSIRMEIGGHGFHGFLGKPKAEGTVTDIKYFANGTLTYVVEGRELRLQEPGRSPAISRSTRGISSPGTTR